MHKNILAIIATFCLFSTNAFAGSWGMGVAGTMASVSASGSESETANTGTDQSVRDATAGNDFIVGSVYAEYSFGDSENFTLGIDYIPGSADINEQLFPELIQQLMQTKLLSKMVKELLTRESQTTLHIARIR